MTKPITRCKHFKGLNVAWGNEERVYMDPLDEKEIRECPFCGTYNPIEIKMSLKEKLVSKLQTNNWELVLTPGQAMTIADIAIDLMEKNK